MASQEGAKIDPDHQDSGSDLVPARAPLTSTPVKNIAIPKNDDNDISIPPNSSINITYDIHDATFQQGSTLNLGSIHQQGRPPPQKSPEMKRSRKLHPLCRKFSRLCTKLAQCFNDAETFKKLRVIASSWGTSNVHDKFLTEVSSATSAMDLFFEANVKCLWHWLDHPILTDLVDDMECEDALRILRDYDQELKMFCENQLISLVESFSSLQNNQHADAFMDVKWKGDKYDFKLADLYKCKEFLVEYLEISESSFVFQDVGQGCITIRWVLLAMSLFDEIKAKVAKSTFPIAFGKGEIESIKLVRTHPHTLPRKNVSESYFFGDFEFKSTYPVPEHCICPICFGIICEAVITPCCSESFCSSCLKKAKEYSVHCPICRKDEYTFESSTYLDKRIIGNLSGKCSKCNWEGNLFNASSHPCVRESHKGLDGDEEPVEASQHPQATGIAEQVSTEELEVADCSKVWDDSMSVASDKDRIVDQVIHLRDEIQTLQNLLPSSNLQRTSQDSASENIGALRDALHSMSALLEQAEERFHDLAASTASEQDSKLSDGEGDDKGIVPVDKPRPDVQQPQTVTTPVDILDPTFPPKEKNPITTTGTLSEAKALEDEDTVVTVVGDNFQERSFFHEARRLIHLAAKLGKVVLLEHLIKDTGASPDIQDEDGCTPLHIAAKKGYSSTVSRLLALGCSVHIADYRESTPLHEAAVSGSLECLCLILDKDPKVDATNRQGQTPLMVASAAGHAAIVKKLFERGSSPSCVDRTGRSPLYLACKSGNEVVVNLLLEEGAIPNTADGKGFTPLHIAAMKGHSAIVEVLVKRNVNLKAKTAKGMTALLYAIANGHTETARKLVEVGADLAEKDKEGRGPLHFAVKSKNISTVIAVVELGCNVDDIAKVGIAENTSSPSMGRIPRRHPLFSLLRRQRLTKSQDPDSEDEEDAFSAPQLFPDHPQYYGYSRFEDEQHKDIKPVKKMLKGGCTPLQLAVVLGEEKIVQFLISKGADIHTKTKEGYGVLHMAAWKGNINLTGKLVELGCNPDEKTKEGLAPIHLAAKFGHTDVAVKLIEGGCDKEIKTAPKEQPRELTAFLIAAMENNDSMINALAEHGCKVDAQTSDGNNAFHLAVMGTNSDSSQHVMSLYDEPPYAASVSGKRESTVEELHRLNCDINKISLAGLTPLDLLEKQVPHSHRWVVYYHNQDYLSAILMRFGAKTAAEIRREELMSRKVKNISDQSETITNMVSHARSHGTRRRISLQRFAGRRSYEKIGAKTPSMYELSTLVVPHVSPMWHEIEEKLGVTLEDSEESSSGDNQERCLRVFKLWLNGQGREPKTWQVVLDVLREIGKGSLATNIMHHLA